MRLCSSALTSSGRPCASRGGKPRTQEEARSFIISSLRRRLGLVICREFARHRIRRVPYIGVPRAVVEQRMQRGQLIGGPQARVPLYVPYADFFQYQAGAGRLAGRA